MCGPVTGVGGGGQEGGVQGERPAAKDNDRQIRYSSAQECPGRTDEVPSFAVGNVDLDNDEDRQGG